jgi:hypothetical protein
MKSLHYGKILKRVATRVWDTLSTSEQATVAADVERETAIAKWFDATVKAEAEAKYNSPDYWMNNPDSFRYSQRVNPFVA